MDRIHIVLIDDDRDDFLILKSLLAEVQNVKFDVEWVSNSASAIAVISKQAADVYLIDYRIDHKTGLEILDELTDAHLKKPIILLTGQGDHEIDIAAMQKGAADFLTKARLTTEILERSIRYCMKRFQDQVKVTESEKFKIESEVADAANKAKSQFLANMSHEIRTPLSAILGYADLALEQGCTEKEKSEFVSVIKRNGENLLALINDILDLSKIEAGELQILEEDFEWRLVIAEVIELLKAKSQIKKLDLTFEADDQIPPLLRGDSQRFRQILINLIGNAIKFTEDGEVTIRCDRMLISGQAKPFLRLQVVDTGIGMTAYEQKKLFKPFQQANSSLTRKFGGTGLGLDLARKLAVAMGGNVTLDESAVDVGSVFSLLLPAQLSEFSQSFSISQRPQKSKQDNVEAAVHLKVLVVEDVIDNQILIRHYLQKANCTVEVASNGREGIRLATASNFDVVLMDIQMPVMDGYEATKWLRLNHYVKPIVALTAHAMSVEKDKALKSGFTDYITKPICRIDLLAILKKYRFILRDHKCSDLIAVN